MREEVEGTVRQLLAGALPRDADFYRLHWREVEQLVEAIEAQTGPLVTWEPPVDLLNYFHLHAPVLAGSKPHKRLPRRTVLTQTTANLHILLSAYSRWAYCFWERASTRQAVRLHHLTTTDDIQSPAEQECSILVQQVLDEQGWQLLTPAEGDEEVPAARPT